MRRTRLWIVVAMLGTAVAFVATAAARSVSAHPATRSARSSFLLQPEGHWVRSSHSRQRVWVRPLMLAVGEHNQIEARSATVQWACQQTFGPGAGPAGEEGCVSPISNATNDYCLSSYGQRAGAPVREYRCNAQSPNQIWWVTASGAYGGESYEIWNAGSSCPPSLAWYSCATPYGKGHGSAYDNNGFCIAVQGGQGAQDASLILNGCEDGDLRAMSWEGLPYKGSALVRFDGEPYNVHYCISSRGQARDGADYVVARCGLQTAEQFKAGTFGIKTFTGTPSPGGGPPENGG